MIYTDGSDAAFARPQSRDQINGYEFQSFGLSKREYFAALALQGFASLSEQYDAKDSAIRAVLYADALIAELNKVKP